MTPQHAFDLAVKLAASYPHTSESTVGTDAAKIVRAYQAVNKAWDDLEKHGHFKPGRSPGFATTD